MKMPPCAGFMGDVRRSLSTGFRAACLAGYVLWVAVLGGCGDSAYRGPPASEDCYPVTGRVFFEGKPCKNAVVRLHRLDGAVSAAPPTKLSGKDQPPSVVSPRGDVNEGGEFRLTTFEADDGAPEGKYSVTISWKDPEGKAGDDSDRTPELLPRRYQDPLQSGLNVEIKADDDEVVLQDFQLTP